MSRYLEIADRVLMERGRDKSAKSDKRVPRHAEAKIRAWLAQIRETDPALIEDVLTRCAQDPDCLAYFMIRAGEVQPERLIGQETR